jgi:hypothetical protein
MPYGPTSSFTAGAGAGAGAGGAGGRSPDAAVWLPDAVSAAAASGTASAIGGVCGSEGVGGRGVIACDSGSVRRCHRCTASARRVQATVSARRIAFAPTARRTGYNHGR